MTAPADIAAAFVAAAGDESDEDAPPPTLRKPETEDDRWNGLVEVLENELFGGRDEQPAQVVSKHVRNPLFATALGTVQDIMGERARQSAYLIAQHGIYVNLGDDQRKNEIKIAARKARFAARVAVLTACALVDEVERAKRR